MENTINIGIDLGTTNSVIAKFKASQVEIFRSPVTWGQTLPSVVGFRKDRVLVGAKAQELLQRDPRNVFGAFKRKMGTTETYESANAGRVLTPIQLSAEVLKELKTFVQDGSPLEAAVITIPASFDTVQSNATKEAGHLAGFQQVVLLQEPIAASLAYANGLPELELQNGHWLVYDLGGGTFDAALVRILDEEMRVVDHIGDNFLGGKDFDSLILELMVIPQLEEKYKFHKLEEQMKSATGKHNATWHVLMHKAEAAKIELSTHPTADIEILMQDDDGQEVDEVFTLRRTDFENMIKPHVGRTLEMAHQMVQRNKLTPKEIRFALMVGGSTYIPYVRESVGMSLGVPVNIDIDPTTAVAIGAAYYAGTKLRKAAAPAATQPEAGPRAQGSAPTEKPGLRMKLAYEKATKDSEVFFAATVEGEIENLFYKITRDDGGFDSGIKPLQARITEDLPLVPNTFNQFSIRVFDWQNNEVPTDAGPIAITQGKFSIVGQPLPEDICMEIDDLDEAETKLHLLFQKNSILPIKKTENRVVRSTIRKGSPERFVINVLEGSADALPQSNKTIGFMAIEGDKLNQDLVQGADVELTFEISESRDLRILAYIPMLDQEFEQIFTPTQRHLPIALLREELDELARELDFQIAAATSREDYEAAASLNKLKLEARQMAQQLESMTDDDVTDRRYQIEDVKRRMSLQVFRIARQKKLDAALGEYTRAKMVARANIEKSGNAFEKQRLDQIVSQEGQFLNSSPAKVRQRARELSQLNFQVLWRDDEYQINLFEHLKQSLGRYDDPDRAQRLIESGRQASEHQNFPALRGINNQLIAMIPREQQDQSFRRATGLM